MKRLSIFILALSLQMCAIILPSTPVSAQQKWQNRPVPVIDPAQRAQDSIMAMHIPLLEVSTDAFSATLPDSLDNSHYPWFPGILNQNRYMSCQQYCGPGYTFAYEINRLRQLDGTLPENRYPPHYTWHFFNKGTNEGVNFLHSFHAMMSQGHMTNADWGADTGMDFTGWIDGYDNYYRAMHNRIRQVWAIPVTSAEGIQTVKQFLYDHLDGSASGGIVCFTSSSPSMLGFGSIVLPPDSPEAGKYVITSWLPYPSHGMTIVGYHDSIRVDINQDGQYTNDIDITGDGLVDVRDWEYGGFRLANSYGTWWADQGFFYVMYSAMAHEFLEGGIWNHQVYVVEPDPGYAPLLTVSLDLEHNARNQIKVMAGVSADPDAMFPDHVISFPLFDHQGGGLWMQGFDTIPELKRMEFGLDVTPLASYIHPGENTRFFILIEEQDPYNTGQGYIHDAAFHFYGSSPQIFDCEGANSPLQHNSTTIMASTGTIPFEPPVITNPSLPAFTLGNPYAIQLTAAQGTPPYSFSLITTYTASSSPLQYEPVTASVVEPHSAYKPYGIVALPFAFPFYGKTYDTVYMNATGLIHFTGDHLPYPYLMSPQDMLMHTAAIAPACSENLTIKSQNGDGMWVHITPDSVIFRWQLSVLGYENQTNIEFNAILYPDGSTVFAYGPISMDGHESTIWQAISAGDNIHYTTKLLLPMEEQSGLSFRFTPPDLPASLTLTSGGLLTMIPGENTTIYSVGARVTDSRGISTEKNWPLSDGLLIDHQLVSSSGFLSYQEPVTLDLTLTNGSSGPVGPVELTLRCDQPGVTIDDSLATTGTLNPGETLSLANACGFTVTTMLPDQTPLPCRVIASTPGKTWQYPFVLTVNASTIEVTEAMIHDGMNGILDAGETAGLLVTISNTGTLPASDLTVTLTSEDSLVSILSEPGIFIGPLGQKSLYKTMYMLKASRETEAWHEAILTFNVSNGSNINVDIPLTLTIGTTPLGIIDLSGSTTSTAMITHFLDSLQVDYDLHTSMIDELQNYSCILFLLGTGYPNSYAFSEDEAHQVINYLYSGGHIYLESYSSWYYGTGPMLEEIFSYSAERVNTYSFNEMTGVQGTMTDGMAYLYPASIPYAIFEVTPKGEAFTLLQNTDNPPKCLSFAYEAPEYRTIGTFIELGKLTDADPPSQKAILFRKYLDFLQVNIDGPFPFFHADTTHICQWHPVRFTDDSFDNITSWQWEFPGGTPALSDQQNPVVFYIDQGVYDVILTVSNGINSWTMHKKSYMHIQVCAGMPEEQPLSKKIRVFPNPASGMVRLSFPGGTGDNTLLEVVDLHGKMCLRKSLSSLIPDQSVELDLSGFRAGIYGIRVTTRDAILTGKVVIVR